MSNQPLGHLQITPGDMDDVVRRVGDWIVGKSRAYCIPINLTKYIVSKRDAKLAEAINAADLVIADGVPIQWLGKRAGLSNIHRVTGVDLAERLLSVSKAKGWSLYFLGASPENLCRATERIGDRYDHPNIAGSRDGYFQADDVPEIIEDINRSNADILFLGLGMPQKEYFLQEHHAQLQVPFCITVGGAIDIWADAKKRTPKWVQTLGMEWLVRSIYDFSKAKNILRYGLQFLKELVFYRPAPVGEPGESPSLPAAGRETMILLLGGTGYIGSAFAKELDATNSLSHLGEVVSGCTESWSRRIPFGTYNLTNTDAITTCEVVSLIQEHLGYKQEFEFFESEKQFLATAVTTARSNCVLDNTKMLNTGIEFSSIREAITQSLKSWKPEGSIAGVATHPSSAGAIE